jgi:hypothetical protein
MEYYGAFGSYPTYCNVCGARVYRASCALHPFVDPERIPLNHKFGFFFVRLQPHGCRDGR